MNMQTWTPREQKQATPKKSGKGLKIALGVVGGVFAIGVVGSLVSENPSRDRSPAAAQSPVPERLTSAKPTPEVPTFNALSAFTAYVASNGTPQEKEAVSHVTKIRGVEATAMRGMVEIVTDLIGGITVHHSTGKLIGGAFEDWTTASDITESSFSKNTYYQVQGQDGKIVSNGNTNA
ncbi:hypothetical protein [Streptomyces sp. NPDC127112]|uniref:hypothetical protein n=1 Tax=Streptomyces sp. NPDC127112 TaxID=3345364 RepID=UPI003645D686